MIANEQLAAKDAEIAGQKAYIQKLEAAYLDTKEDLIFHTGTLEEIVYSTEKAKDALEKIRKS